ncbi:MAG: hypothetical protein JOZ39_11660 [Chloroflexi bacterium]|nr:hypothetical protein [Chloroflexota bacterium]
MASQVVATPDGTALAPPLAEAEAFEAAGLDAAAEPLDEPDGAAEAADELEAAAEAVAELGATAVLAGTLELAGAAPPQAASRSRMASARGALP